MTPDEKFLVYRSQEYCDSSLNLMQGCDGCELWTPARGNRHCYAGAMTNIYKGRKGWPSAFELPELFLERLDAARKWKDLTGQHRPHKPWLDGRPRVVFLNDMGDTFTESLPIDWMAPLLPRLADSPHVYMLLTKRASRMLEFTRMHPLPPNVWPGVSVTTQATVRRVDDLLKIASGGPKWISAEPLLGPVTFPPEYFPYWVWECCKCGASGGALFKVGNPCGCEPPEGYGDVGECDGRVDNTYQPGVELVIIGGESGPKSRPCNVAWIRSLVEQCQTAQVPCFVKQLGGNVEACDTIDAADYFPGKVRLSEAKRPNARVHLKDPKGGDPTEWPEDLRVREFPEVAA